MGKKRSLKEELARLHSQQYNERQQNEQDYLNLYWEATRYKSFRSSSAGASASYLCMYGTHHDYVELIKDLLKERELLAQLKKAHQ